MPKFAMVIVVDGADETTAWEKTTELIQAGAAEFVGGPWEVKDQSEQEDYTTEVVIDQLPEIEMLRTDRDFEIEELRRDLVLAESDVENTRDYYENRERKFDAALNEEFHQLDYRIDDVKRGLFDLDELVEFMTDAYNRIGRAV